MSECRYRSEDGMPWIMQLGITIMLFSIGIRGCTARDFEKETKAKLDAIAEKVGAEVGNGDGD